MEERFPDSMMIAPVDTRTNQFIKMNEELSVGDPRLVKGDI